MVIIGLLAFIAFLLIIISFQIVAVNDKLEEIEMNTLKTHLRSYDIICRLEGRKK